MRFLAYLLTLFLVGTAVAQNPTILQGNYITNVFGNSNFVLNPNAQTNTANVTNATRVITTPLVATSEFNLNLTNGSFATWTLRTFDAGMKGQNCEARFTYRGFATATTTAQIVQNSLVVAQLVLTPSTDPRIASINFPCGDLSFATTFRIAQTTANMTTVTPNEIGGIYVGLATNMANVAQAENVVQASKTSVQAFTSGVADNVIFNVKTKDVYGEFDTTNGRFTAKRAGDYLIQTTALSDAYTWTAGNYSEIQIRKNNNIVCRVFKQIQATQSINLDNQVTCTISLAVGDYVQTHWDQNRGTTNINTNATYTYTSIYRFPSSSELVVKPETQNVFGAARFTNGASILFSGVAAPTGYGILTDSGFATNVTRYGKASAPLSSGCFGGVACSVNDLGFSIPNMPIGTYNVKVFGLLQAIYSASDTECSFQILEAVSGTSVGAQAHVSQATAGVRDFNSSYAGIYYNPSVATRNFIVRANKTSGTSGGQCQANAASSVGREIYMEITPVDQPSNSALYVQGPVLGAQTGAAIPSGYLGKSEFGGGNGSSGAVSTGTSTVYTISNVTPGVYLVRYYASAQRAGAFTATYYGYSCAVTSNASVLYNWFDYLNAPQSFIGSDGASFTGFGSGGHLAGSLSSNIGIVSVTSTTTYYLRCAYDSNNSGVNVFGGAEFIRLN